jgi:hypothetical protein
VPLECSNFFHQAGENGISQPHQWVLEKGHNEGKENVFQGHCPAYQLLMTIRKGKTTIPIKREQKQEAVTCTHPKNKSLYQTTITPSSA